VHFVEARRFVGFDITVENHVGGEGKVPVAPRPKDPEREERSGSKGYGPWERPELSLGCIQDPPTEKRCSYCDSCQQDPGARPQIVQYTLLLRKRAHRFVVGKRFPWVFFVKRVGHKLGEYASMLVPYGLATSVQVSVSSVSATASLSTAD